jgi:hypothetical protein
MIRLVNNKLNMIWKEDIVLSWHLPRGTEEITKDLSGQAVSCATFETVTI